MVKVKKIKVVVKIQAQAGKATPAPPIGPALAQHGINIGEFVSKFNEQTREMGDTVVPALVTIYEDRSFDFILKTPPASILIKKMANKEKGSGNPKKDKIGSITDEQLTKIAEHKLPDLNAHDVDQAKKIIAGTARSMGIEISK